MRRSSTDNCKCELLSIAFFSVPFFLANFSNEKSFSLSSKSAIFNRRSFPIIEFARRGLKKVRGFFRFFNPYGISEEAKNFGLVNLKGIL